MTTASAVEDWPTVLRKAFARAGKAAVPVDLADLLGSPEAMAARGLTSALLGLATSAAERRLVADAVARGDLLGFREAGHGESGQDLDTGYRAEDRADRYRRSDSSQIRLLRRYCDWRLTGAPVIAASGDLAKLDRRLAAVANYGDPPDLCAIARDLEEVRGAERSQRLEEYKDLGADLLARGLSTDAYLPGPPAGPGLPRRSWMQEPVAEDPYLAPAEPADETTPLVI